MNSLHATGVARKSIKQLECIIKRESVVNACDTDINIT